MYTLEKLNANIINDHNNYRSAHLVVNPEHNSVISEVISRAKELANGHIPSMKKVAEEFESKASNNDYYPFYRIFYSLFDYFSGNLNEAEEDLQALCAILWPSSEIQGYVEIIRGSNLRSLGALDLAVISLNRSLKLLKPNGELEVFRGFSYYHLGAINVIFEDFDKAESLFISSLNSAEYTKENTAMFRSCMGLADLYLRTDKFQEGKIYLDRATLLADSSPLKAVVLSQKAVYFCSLGHFEEANIAIDECIKLRRFASLKDALNTALIIKAEILIGLNQSESAIEIGTEVLPEIRKIKTKLKERDCLRVISKAYRSIGDYKNAFNYLEKFEELNKEIIQNQYKEILKHKNEFITQQRNEIFSQHQDIKASINYSKNLQTAILPSEEILDRCLPDHFVLYLPKDIVAGDFYWISCSEMRPADNLEEDWVLFASADCTGHGVPGAIVSFICSDLLNRAVSEFKLIDPAAILDKVTELIIKRFGMNNHLITDGMDISLAAYNKKTNQLRWAGANNSLMHVRNKELKDIKGDRQGIGYYKNIKSFTPHSIQIKKGDVIYLGTDGYPDQFGGEKGKKIGQRRYKDKLTALHTLPLKEQKKQLNDFVDFWAGDEDQLDDICIIGVQF